MTNNNRIAIVTGGGRGLGRAMALGLAGVGWRVAITAARSREEVEAVAREAPAGQIFPILADASNAADCDRLVREVESQLGPVALLVNNAARGMRFVSEQFLSDPTRFWQVAPETWRMAIDTNVNGPFYLTRLVVPGMINRGWGRIINISMNHSTMRRPGFSPYGPSKAALESETIIWAQDLAGTGVTVNALLPGGASRTGMIPAVVPEAIRQKLIEPECMVPPLLWLVSNSADGVTGQRLNAVRWNQEPDPALKLAKASESAGWTLP